jgi:hypothetical protein
MKCILIIILLSFIPLVNLRCDKNYSFNSKILTPLCIYEPTKKLACLSVEKYSKRIENFLEALGYYESRNIWDTINSIGACGRFQLMPIALEEVGFKGNIKNFLNDTVLQKKCVVTLLKRNKYYLKSHTKYIGKRRHGVYITLSGMLGAAHLGGAKSVKRFLDTGYIARDKNGTTVVDYLKLFKNYKLEKCL